LTPSVSFVEAASENVSPVVSEVIDSIDIKDEPVEEIIESRASTVPSTAGPAEKKKETKTRRELEEEEREKMQ
jgi:hypothetical protein